MTHLIDHDKPNLSTYDIKRPQLKATLDGLLMGPYKTVGKMLKNGMYLNPAKGYRLRKLKDWKMLPSFSSESVVRVQSRVHPVTIEIRSDWYSNPLTLTDFVKQFPLLDTALLQSKNKRNFKEFKAYRLESIDPNKPINKQLNVQYFFKYHHFHYRVSLFTARKNRRQLLQESARFFKSFRIMSLNELRQMEVSFLSLYTVKKGETISSIMQSHLNRNAEELETFLILNGLTKSSKLRVGQIVKIKK